MVFLSLPLYKGQIITKLADNGRKKEAIDFRVFRVMVVEVARQAMAKNGQKWPKMVENGFPRENDRKWIFASIPSFPSFPYYLYC